MATLATKGVTIPKVFVVDDQSAYAVPLRGYVEAGLTKVAGASLVGGDSVPNTTTDYSAMIAKIKAVGATVVIYTGYYSAAAIFIKQLRDSGSRAIFAASSDSYNNEFIKLAGKSAEGARISGVPNLKDLDPSADAIFQKSMGASSGVYTIESFDAASILLEGIAQGNTSRSTILNWVKNYNGVGISGNSFK